ncbi:HLA class II histocompatibility antigen gamma chain isoform X3 [Bufo gargarizans]|uniref:HLA class II histocompatibility antigen gamma chain isoform X3 n=1 Tax=Bufo gargarizans TaxID=30331 RepID=UPI001CF3BA18|nr:HLA class II histocompatibility antigen gamma chain isoform X3 [Bufo gargarizans]
MAEETQNLVQEEMPAENSITVGSTETRTITCNKRNVVPALSIFVALLIAGQAVSVYFITQQQGKINELDTTTRDMKLKEMIDKLPGSPPSQNRPKLRMSTFNIPLAVRDDDGTQQKLENKAMASNHVEDAVQYILLMGNPLRNYPSFNGTILENLKKLRKTLSYQEWMLFDSWMQQWYLFYLVQSSKAPETTPEPNADISTGAPVMTPCQLTAKRHSLPGAYVPQCDSNGDFTPMQCWRSTGYCWCVYRNGTEVEGTRARVKIDCSVINESMDVMQKMEDY